MSAAYPRWPKLTAVNFAARAVCAAPRSNETLLPARGCRSLRLLPEVAPDRLQNINQARYPLKSETIDPANSHVILKGLRLSTGEGNLLAQMVEKRKVDRGQLIGWPSDATKAKAEKCPRCSQLRRAGGIEQLAEVRVIAQGIELPCGRGAWDRANGYLAPRRWLGRCSSAVAVKSRDLNAAAVARVCRMAETA
jgi:hypothetical protein